VEVHCDEGVAIHIGLEPCVHARESNLRHVASGQAPQEENPGPPTIP
jgi:hypothetical protein